MGWNRRRRARELSWLDVIEHMPLHAEHTEAEHAQATAFVLGYQVQKHLVASAPIRFVDASSGAVFSTSLPAFTPSAADAKELQSLLAKVVTHSSKRTSHPRARGHYWGVSIDAADQGCWWFFKGVAELRHSDGSSSWFCDSRRTVEKWVVRAAVRYGFEKEVTLMGAPWV